MPQPDWAKKQHTDERSPFHGRKDKDHGPHEHGMGAKEEHPAHPGLPFLSALGLELPAGVTLDTPEDQLAGLTTLPALMNIPYAPPVTNQGTTPMCVAHSRAYDQNQHDRPEQGGYLSFDKPRFFKAIGGTADGASMTAALDRSVSVGYPTTVAGSTGSLHRLASYARIANTVTAFKSALVNRKHGVLKIGPWYHSWFHPLASGKLPARDYVVGWHARWYRGYNDLYGGRGRNSWGALYGLSGDFFEPYPYLVGEGFMWVTTDR